MARWKWPRYVPVAERRAKAQKRMQQLRKKGKNIQPVHIEGRTIAHSFWGKGWCTHLESFSDFSNRLPRGRTYVRNGSVCHLEIQPGRITAMVSGSKIYNVTIRIDQLASNLWKNVKEKCSGQIGSWLELVQGRFSEEVMQVVTDARTGLFPKRKEISLGCDCPDCAIMCKHVAAVLYGIGHRLDYEPELLFTLRGVDPQELISADISLPDGQVKVAEGTISDNDLGDIFGIEMDEDVHFPEAGSQGQAAVGQKTEQTKTGSKKGKPPLNPPTGQKILRLRRQCGQSRAQFAQRLGVSAASVSRWEKARGNLSLHFRTLDALRKVYAEVHRG